TPSGRSKWAHGPWGSSEFAAFSSNFAGTILDHGVAANPFKDYSAVFVPYCTGDLHAGDAVKTYSESGDSRIIHHKGHANVLAYLTRVAATFKAPGQIAVTGSSAGGGGVLFNYASFREYWPSTPMLVIDDSLPFFQGDGVAPSLRSAWYANWNLAP